MVLIDASKLFRILLTISSLFLANMRLHTMGSMGRADVREKALKACYCRAWKLARRAVEPAMDQ